jgi:acyl carrier protein
MNLINKRNVKMRVLELVSEALQIPISQVSEGLSLGDIPQWDSMGHMGIMLLLEERFNVEIDTSILNTLTSIPSICAFLEKMEQI